MVTVITPCTGGRLDMLQRVIEMVGYQDYAGKVQHLTDMQDATIGYKRNYLCNNADGEIILHMDSDDCYQPDWITRSVEALISSSANITGLSSCYFHDTTRNNVHEYTAPEGQLYLVGATLCYWRKQWEKKPFKDIHMGEDTDFITNAGKLYAHEYKAGFMATIHGNNTCSHLALPSMKKLPQNEAAQIINNFYASPTV